MMTLDTARITFLMVGAQRCGTTWVDAALREHPEVFLPPQKQTYFFDQHYDRGLAWYEGNFAQVRAEHVAVGEIASGYCLLHAIPRVAKHYPHIRIIMAMRDPVDRAYSYYISRRMEGRHQWSSFEEAIELDQDVLNRGRYVEQVERFLEYYRPEQVLLLFYEDLVANDRAYLRSMLRFIGVDESFESRQFGQRRFTGQVAEKRYQLERVGFGPLFKMLKHSRIGDMMRRIYSESKLPPATYRSKIQPATLRRLIDYFGPLNERLAILAKRDLSHWNQTLKTDPDGVDADSHPAGQA